MTTTIDSASGEPVEDTTPNVLRMPANEERTERVKKARKTRRAKTEPSLAETAQNFAADMPDAINSNVQQAADGIQQAVQGATSVAGAGLNIGKLLLIGLGVYLFLEFTADPKLKRYAGD